MPSPERLRDRLYALAAPECPSIACETPCDARTCGCPPCACRACQVRERIAALAAWHVRRRFAAIAAAGLGLFTFRRPERGPERDDAPEPELPPTLF